MMEARVEIPKPSPKQIAKSDYSGWAMLVADWGIKPGKRVVYEVDVDHRTIKRRSDPDAAGWTVQKLAAEAQEIVSRPNRRVDRCLIALDVAIGFPAGLLTLMIQNAGQEYGNPNLAGYLRNPPNGASQPGESGEAHQWSWERPYIRVPAGDGALTAFRETASNFGVTLTRAVDEMTGGRSPLILSGIPGTVGSGSREVLRELWNQGGEAGWRNGVAVWPFDGPLTGRDINTPSVFVGEIYPRSLYGHVLDDRDPVGRRRLIVAKTIRQTRELVVDHLRRLNWHLRPDISVALSEEYLNLAIDNEDDFDAYLSALGLLRLAVEGISLEDETLGEWEGRSILDRRAEGGMLGFLSTQARNGQTRFGAGEPALVLPINQPQWVNGGDAPNVGYAVWTTEAILIRSSPAIVFTGLPPGTSANRREVIIEGPEGDQYRLVIGDSHMIWRAHHQTPEQLNDFDALFEILAEAPGVQHPVLLIIEDA